MTDTKQILLSHYVKKLKELKNKGLADYEILINGSDSFKVRYDHDNKKISFLNSNIPFDFKKITHNYSDDYFDKSTQELIKNSIILLQMIYTGQFEYDTAHTDRILYDIKYAVNKIDI